MSYSVTPDQAAAYDSAIYNQAMAMGMPDFIGKNMVGQARYETGAYTSDNLHTDNNAFGYKYVVGGKWQLPQPGIVSTEGDNYAVYNSIQDSASEVVDWLNRRQAEGKLTIADLTDPTSYAIALKNCDYYGETAGNYAAGLIYELSTINWATIGTAAEDLLPWLIAAGVAAYFVFK